jgi:hypothetical protein
MTIPTRCLLILGLVAGQLACGGTGSDNFVPGGGAGSDSDASAAGSGGGGGSGLPDSAIAIETSGSETSLDESETCAAQSQKAERAPLDMYIMMDESGSMDFKASGSSSTKWELVTQALSTFLNDKASEGIGVGIQYFPLWVNANLPTCVSESDCASNESCLSDGTSSQCYRTCASNSDCSGAECQTAAGYKYCTNVTCDATVYAHPEQEIDVLPAAATKIIQSMSQHKPYDGTPTLPALKGAIAHAQNWAIAHLDHKVIVVYATDGEPTLCPITDSDPGLISQVISQCVQVTTGAYNGTPPVPTFVIGVLSSENNPANLHSIAHGGGTDQAFIVEPNKDVAQQFAAALEKIRGQALACEFMLPTVDAGALDFEKVNVQYTPNGAPAQFIPYVDEIALCDATKGGWYYDIKPSQGTPKRILMCPATCDQLKADTQAQVDIQIGCKRKGPA